MLTDNDKMMAMQLFDLHSIPVMQSLLRETVRSLPTPRIDPLPSAAGIKTITDLLYQTIKKFYPNTVLERDEAIQWLFMNGCCPLYTTLITQIYERLGNRVADADQSAEPLPILNAPQTKQPTAQTEQPNTLYVVGYGWREANPLWQKQQTYCFHQFIKLNHQYFDICGGKSQTDFMAHLHQNFDFDQVLFKYNADHLSSSLVDLLATKLTKGQHLTKLSYKLKQCVIGNGDHTQPDLSVDV